MKNILFSSLVIVLFGCSFIEETEEVISSNLNSEKTSEEKTTKNNTLDLPSATSIPPSATSIPPSATSIPPTATSIPPTATPIPPTASRIQYPRNNNVIINLSKYNDEDILSWEDLSYKKINSNENTAIFSRS